MSVGEEGKSPSGGGECLSGKSVSPVSALEGYLGGVVGESAAKRGYESPAPLQRIACGGHSGDSDLQEAATSTYITLTFTPNDTPKMSQNLRYLLVALLIMYMSAVPNS